MHTISHIQKTTSTKANSELSFSGPNYDEIHEKSTKLRRTLLRVKVSKEGGTSFQMTDGAVKAALDLKKFKQDYKDLIKYQKSLKKGSNKNFCSI